MNIQIMQAEALLNDFVEYYKELSQDQNLQSHLSKTESENLVKFLNAMKTMYIAKLYIEDIMGAENES